MRADLRVRRQIPAGDHEPLGIAQDIRRQPIASRLGADEDEDRVDVLDPTLATNLLQRDALDVAVAFDTLHLCPRPVA